MDNCIIIFQALNFIKVYYYSGVIEFLRDFTLYGKFLVMQGDIYLSSQPYEFNFKVIETLIPPYN